MILSDIIIIFGVVFGMIIGKYYFMVARFIMGFSLGMNFSVVFLYIREVTPLYIIGRMGNMF